MAIDRTKFVDETTSSSLKQEDTKADNVSTKKNQKFADYLKIDVGLNRFRCYPPHPGTKTPFIVLKQLWWLPFLVEKKDDKGKIVKDRQGNIVFELKNRGVFDARVHSNVKVDEQYRFKENGRDVDIVHEYIEFLRKTLKDAGYDDTYIEEKMIHVYGSYQKKIQALAGKPEFVCYADKIISLNSETGEILKKEFGRVPFGKAVKLGINDKIALEEANAPLGTISKNPFTPVDKGRLLLVTYDDTAKKAVDYYKTDIDTSYDPKTDKLRFYPLSENDLEQFMQYPSLESMFIDVYTRHDFDLAVQGLKVFDSEKKYGVFDHDEFIEIVEKLRPLYREKEQTPAADATVLNDEVDDENDSNIETMNREQLKQYIRTNAYPLQVRKSMSDDDIRNMIIDFEKNGSEDDELEEDPPFTGGSTVASQKEETKTEEIPPMTEEMPTKRTRKKASDLDK